MATRTRTWTLIGTLALTAALAAGLLLGPFQPTAEASGSLSASAGTFTGTDANGNFQAALDDAVAQAETAAGCCDIRIQYEVLDTTGQRGGFIYLNDISVRIHARW